MTAARRLLIVFLVIASVPVRASARCEGAVVLGTFHDAYRATLNEHGSNQRNAAISLLFIAGGKDNVMFAQQVARSGVEVSAERLGEVLSDARQFASDTLSNGAVGDPEFRHGQNVQWLADIFIASGCQNSLATTSRTNVEITPSVPERKEAFQAPEAPSRSHLLIIGGVLVAGLLIAIAAYKVHNSFIMRRRRVERLPRVPIALPIQVSYAFPDGERRQVDVKAVDISVGGMKLSWSQPPGAGTEISVNFSEDAKPAQIMWSNSFYAGVMFSAPLSSDELNGFLAMSQPLPA